MMNDKEKERIEKCVVQVECINKLDESDIEFGTGFFVEKNIIITASHVINKYYTNPSEYCINIIPINANKDKPIKVKKTIENKRNNYVSILELEEVVEEIIPLKFTSGYEIKRDDSYFIFGHPLCKRTVGAKIENKITTTINEYQSRKANWDLNLSDERVEDFDGFSGSPVVINNMLVGIVQTESKANGKTLSIGMSSIDIMKNFIPDEFCKEYNVFNIKDGNVKIYTIDEMDQKLRESTNPSIGLDFFEIDDDEFKKKFSEKNKNNIYVVGKSREEALYCVLNESKHVFDCNNVAIIGDIESWEYLRGKVNNAILIPNFYVGEVVAIKNNVNIFIYGEDEHCTNQNKIELKRRTRSTIIKKLEEAGLQSQIAYDYVDKTNGLFIPLKRKLFNGQYNISPAWCNEKNASFVAALLCGKWTESQGDKHVIETLSGKSYDEFMKDILPFTRGGEPFVIEVLSFSEKIYQLANSEFAWEYFAEKIDETVWNKFKEVSCQVISTMDPIFNEPFNEHYMASSYAEKPENSNALKLGMIRSLIFMGILRGSKYQNEIDSVVKTTLSTIDSVKSWGYFAQFFTQLCEASPEAIIERLEKELKTPTGLMELFGANSSEFSGRNYYTHVLWAIEQLLLYKKYAVRAMKLLFLIDSKNLKYRISNSPKNILKEVFCAWFSMSVLKSKDKILLAQMAIKEYENFWDLLFNELPGKHQVIHGSGNKPQYRNFDEIEQVTNKEIYDTYNAYAKLCIEHIGCNIDRWKKVIGEFSIFPNEMLDELLGKLSSLICKMSDSDKSVIKDALRNEIYRHRFFSKSGWAMDEMRLQKLELLLSSITFEDEVYEYLYLFKDKYNMPILHPIPFNKGDSAGKDENILLREKEVVEGLTRFKHNNLDLIRLIELVDLENYRNLGEYIAKYYSNGIFDSEFYAKLIGISNIEKIILSYIYWIYKSGDKSVIKKAKLFSKGYNNKDDLYVGILGIEDLNYENHPEIIEEEPHIKQLYWSKPIEHLSIADDKVTLTWILNELKKYNNAISYIQCLYYGMKHFDPEEILNYLSALKNFNNLSCANSMISYYLTELMAYIEKSFAGIYDKYDDIFSLEMLLRGIMEWETMKCAQYLFKHDSRYYAEMINNIYLHEGEEKSDLTQEQMDLSKKLFDLYHKALFCPCENNGDINLEELENWVAKFTEQLTNQKQINLLGHVLGRLFAYSPVGKDGYYPHEAVRKIIEDISEDNLRASYRTAEINKRGVYSPDAGKTEKEMALKYKENAEEIRILYPESAKIYDDLYNSYWYQSEVERRVAEDGYY